MKLAILADLHANLEAVTACLAHAGGAGATEYAFLGDLVGYGADPGPVVDLVRGLVAKGALAVRGNHDAAVVAGASELMHEAAAAAVAWTRDRLDRCQLDFLAGLPLTVRRAHALFVHASADAPGEWLYVTDAVRAADCLAAAGGASWVFAGHVHEQMLYYIGASHRPVPFKPTPGVPVPVPTRRQWLAIVGSAGQPRDGSAAACYAMADLDRMTLTFHRVPYDVATAAGKVRAAGLPEALAARLERGA